MSTDTVSTMSEANTQNGQATPSKVHSCPAASITVNNAHGDSIEFRFYDVAEYQSVLEYTLDMIQSKLMGTAESSKQASTMGKQILRGEERKKARAEMNARILATKDQYPEGFEPAALRSEMYGDDTSCG